METYNLSTEFDDRLNSPLIIKPNVFKDERGLFFESWNQTTFNNIFSKNIVFVQDNCSLSKSGVIRGLHYQLPPIPQAKLVRCSVGKIFDVVVDIRSKSNTFGKWAAVELSESNNKQLWVPEGFAHGFLTLSDLAFVEYKTTNKWAKDLERSIIWSDKEISIEWPINQFIEFSLSQKDSDAPNLKTAKLKGDIF